MAILNNKNFRIHTFDIETSNAEFSHVVGNYSVQEFLDASRSGDSFYRHQYAKVHARSQLLQLWASDLTKGEGWINPEGPGFYHNKWGGKTAYHVSTFSRGIFAEAAKFGRVSEEQALLEFYQGLHNSILTSNRPVVLSGWNMVYDLSGVEAATYRYESLRDYRGFFARHHGNGLRVVDSSESFFNAAWQYGQVNRDFANRYFHGVGSAEGLRNLSGWGVENIARAAGGPERLLPGFRPHRANWDARLTQAVSERFAYFQELHEKGVDFEQAMREAQILQEGQSAQQFFSTVFSDVKQTAQTAPRSRPIPSYTSMMAGFRSEEDALRMFSNRQFKAGLLVAGAAVVAGTLAFGKRRDRQTQITGLSETGVGADRRHRTSDFGSGWRGFDRDDGRYSPSLRVAELLTAGYGINKAHRYSLRNNPNYASGLYNFVQNLEYRSPNQFLRTFRLAELMSSYMVDEVHYSHSQLVQGGQLTELGSTIHRMGRGRVDVLNATEGLHFRRMERGSAYLDLLGHDDVKIRFTAGGHIAGSAARYGADLHNREVPRYPYESWWDHHRRTQNPGNARGGFAEFVNGEKTWFQPYMSEVGTEEAGLRGAWNRVKTFNQKAGTVAFEFIERPQHLMAQIGLGLRQGTYNKVFHMPFAGEGGLVNEMLKRRVLPVFLGYMGLKWVDYQLDHKPSTFIAGLPLKARVFHSELTDRTPGARRMTDWYANVVPGPQYGPLALPVGGMFLGGMVHYADVLRGMPREVLPTLGSEYRWARNLPRFLQQVPKPAAVGAAIGAALMLPFVPGMLGDRKTASERRRIYSGEELVPVRQGRWWDMGSTAWEGGRIKYFRPHWYSLFKSRAEDASLYGDEKEKWAHNPILHPIRYLRDPYWLEKKHYEDRPYPVTSPAFSDVPLVGPILAATIGKLVKPVKRMHDDEWNPGDDYALYNRRLEPKDRERALPPPIPTEEFSSFSNIVNHEADLFADFIGMPGFMMKSLYGNYFPDQDKGKQVFLQGSRQMTNASRRYYERELGAMLGPNPGGDEVEPYGYSEALRRFIQPERGIKQVNPLHNTMPSWLPGDEYMVDFHKGDPYASLPEGYARLPGEGYAALHPELSGVNPEDYPALTKFQILADVAPYSRQFSKYRDIVRGLAKRDTATRIEFERTMEQVRQVRESSIRTRERRFTAETDTIEGTIKKATPYGVELNEFPGRKFSFSSLGMSAADLSSLALAENNRMSREDVATEVDNRRRRLNDFVQNSLAPGTSVRVTVGKGAAEHEDHARAVIEAGGLNINRALVNEGLARERTDLGGAESQAMYGGLAKLLGKYAEGASFTGDSSRLNPLRYVPQPYNTKLWQNRTALSQYEQQEVYGTRMRRWHRPIHDMIEPYMRGITKRVTGKAVVPEDVQFRRDLNTLSDVLQYLRASKGGYTNEARRTSTGTNQFSDPEAVARTLKDREASYFRQFLKETDPKQRAAILKVASPELARALTTQWVSKDAAIARAEGKDVGSIGEGGRLFTKEGLDEYSKAKTQLDYGDYQRSKEIAEFFNRTGFRLPDEDSAAFDEALDYQDVKLKIIQNEGYDAHDFNIFDDRASVLWRKPYVDGAARELTVGDDRNVEQLRKAVERMMVNGRDKNPKVKVASHPSHVSRSNVRVTVDIDHEKEILKDARRNPERYEEEE